MGTSSTAAGVAHGCPIIGCTPSSSWHFAPCSPRTFAVYRGNTVGSRGIETQNVADVVLHVFEVSQFRFVIDEALSASLQLFSQILY